MNDIVLGENGLPALLTFDELKAQQEAEEAAKHFSLPEENLPYLRYGGLGADYCEALAKVFQVHTDLIASAMLVAVGAAAGKRATIKYGAYSNNPCLWLCIAARKGYNKSTPISQVLAPLKQINEDLISRHITEYREWQAAGGENSGREVPPKRKLLISDSTPEERYLLLSNNNLLYYRDELFGGLKDIGRYTASGEVEQNLSIWSGEDFSIDRKTSGSFYVKRPFMSWIGTIQKTLLADAFGSMALRGNGFNDRWLFCWIEDDHVSEDVAEQTIPEVLIRDWDRHLQEIWHMPATTYHLTPEAKREYQDYQRYVRRIGNDERCNSDMQGHFSKMEIYCLRLCMCVHLLTFGRKAPIEVDEDIMHVAVRTCKAFDYMHWKTIQRITGEEQRQALSDKDIIRELVKRFEIKNQSALARCVGRTQQYINKILNQ